MQTTERRKERPAGTHIREIDTGTCLGAKQVPAFIVLDLGVFGEPISGVKPLHCQTSKTQRTQKQRARLRNTSVTTAAIVVTAARGATFDHSRQNCTRQEATYVLRSVV